ncbi:MAG TPA: pyridoxamine 5'-phosphate oxidase family protein [Pseudonocardia sp.]|jgi:nitroimidazol reductase NimA-like FMN-containing flavoprotein (pyridoxamine 5'-phosphate oxidase superfamily)|nr:pyridoxamine 5'-phosphate oxidase family protein [Pseudonocardia sp.]
MALNKEERESFLAEPHVAALSVVEGPDKAPLTVPIWYQYTPGGEAWVLTGVGSRKARAIEAAGRFTLMVERRDPTNRYVSVSGAVVRHESGTDEQNREMAYRYLPADKAEEFLKFSEEHLPDHVLFAIQPEVWLSADLGEW